MTASSTPARSDAAIDDARLSQVLPAAAGYVARQALFDVGQRDCQARDPQRHPKRLPHALQLAGDQDAFSATLLHQPCLGSAPRYSHLRLQRQKMSGWVVSVPY